jgi:hypothetical protein
MSDWWLLGKQLKENIIHAPAGTEATSEPQVSIYSFQRTNPDTALPLHTDNGTDTAISEKQNIVEH